MTGPRRKAYALSCTDPQWERIKDRARRHGSRSAARFVVERSLAGLPAAQPRLVLSEAEQRAALERLEAIAARLAGPSGGQEALLASLHKRVGVLVRAAMRDMHREGRRDELRSLLARELGEEEVRAAMAQLDGHGR